MERIRVHTLVGLRIRNVYVKKHESRSIRLAVVVWKSNKERHGQNSHEWNCGLALLGHYLY